MTLEQVFLSSCHSCCRLYCPLLQALTGGQGRSFPCTWHGTRTPASLPLRHIDISLLRDRLFLLVQAHHRGPHPDSPWRSSLTAHLFLHLGSGRLQPGSLVHMAISSILQVQQGPQLLRFKLVVLGKRKKVQSSARGSQEEATLMYAPSMDSKLPGAGLAISQSFLKSVPGLSARRS